MPEFIGAGPFSVPATTGIKSKRFVALNSTSGKLRYPANGALAIGVTFADSSTGSTNDVSLAVQAYGVAEVEAAGSTLAAGALIAASSVGRAIIWSTGKMGLGQMVYGSSGSTGRIVSVLLKPFGHSTAI